MAYRDDRDALLARVQSLATELAAARDEIERLQREIRGDAPISPKNESARVAAVEKELQQARLLLAGLMDGQIVGPRELAKRPNPVLKALREALRTALYRKFGSIDVPTRKAIVATHSADRLIEQITAVAMESDREKVLRMLRQPSPR